METQIAVDTAPWKALRSSLSSYFLCPEIVVLESVIAVDHHVVALLLHQERFWLLIMFLL